MIVVFLHHRKKKVGNGEKAEQEGAKEDLRIRSREIKHLLHCGMAHGPCQGDLPLNPLSLCVRQSNPSICIFA